MPGGRREGLSHSYFVVFFSFLAVCLCRISSLPHSLAVPAPKTAAATALLT